MILCCLKLASSSTRVARRCHKYPGNLWISSLKVWKEKWLTKGQPCLSGPSPEPVPLSSQLGDEYDASKCTRPLPFCVHPIPWIMRAHSQYCHLNKPNSCLKTSRMGRGCKMLYVLMTEFHILIYASCLLCLNLKTIISYRKKIEGKMTLKDVKSGNNYFINTLDGE